MHDLCLSQRTQLKTTNFTHLRIAGRSFPEEFSAIIFIIRAILLQIKACIYTRTTTSTRERANDEEADQLNPSASFSASLAAQNRLALESYKYFIMTGLTPSGKRE